MPFVAVLGTSRQWSLQQSPLVIVVSPRQLGGDYRLIQAEEPHFRCESIGRSRVLGVFTLATSFAHVQVD